VNVLQKNHVATMVLVVQPHALETGKVQVDAKAMAAGLQAEGHIALYGIYFDSGKSEVKAESAAQLGEMARLLQGDAGLKVYVVGHTDSQGSLDGNLALSRARAQAVVDALVRTHKVDARRLAAAGVASYAPVASNASEPGRAKNRRVELVLQ
jgi:outer membrane protein OmpA-like peptidoglycan-associated protein